MSNTEKSRIRQVAATLLNERLPDGTDDYPRRTPKKVLRVIEKHNEKLRRLACELVDLINR